MNLDRLPKWAQEHIAELQRQRDAAVSELRKMERDQKPSRIWVESNPCTGERCGPSGVRRYIDARTVTFEIDKNNTIDVGFDIRDERFLLRADHAPLMILPEVSNSVEVRIKK